MSNKIKNLGKACCKVEFYDSSKNIQRDESKLRKSYFFKYGDQPKKNATIGSYKTAYIQVKNDTGDKTLSACIIPEPLYNPVDNLLDTVQEDTVYVNWKKLSKAEISKTFRNMIEERGGNFDTDNQKWRVIEQSYEKLTYSENEYNKNRPDNLVPPTPPPAATDPPAEPPPPPEQSTRKVLVQHEGEINTWWGIKTINKWRMPGGAFWVTIQPTITSVGDGQDAFFCVNFSKYDKTDFLFTISASGLVAIIHKWDEASATPPTTNKDELRVQEVGLPGLANDFRTTTSAMRIGFLNLCGRLTIMYNGSYDTITIPGRNLKEPPFIHSIDLSVCDDNFVSRNCEIQAYGYGCQTNIDVCEMNFHRKTWNLISSMDPDIHYDGYKFPDGNVSSGTGTIVSGTYVPGFLINMNISQAQYEVATCPYYSGQFEYYSESDTVVSPNTSMSTRTTTPVPSFGTAPTDYDNNNLPPTTSTLSTGCLKYIGGNLGNEAHNWWGGIEVKRAEVRENVGKKKTISQDVFKYYAWYYTLRTYDWIDSDGNVHEDVRFPIVYNISGTKKMEEVASTHTPTLDTDFSSKVTDVSITYSLDNVKPTRIIKSARVTAFDSDESDSIRTYLSKARFVKIYLKWSNSETVTYTNADLAFEGIAFANSSTYEPGNRTVTFECIDYWKILERMQVKNSPFYDGFEVISVIRDLAERAGIKVVDATDRTGPVNKRKVPFYFLGSGYTFDEPAHKYNSADSLLTCMENAMKMFAYYMWFDEGILYVGVVPGDFDMSAIDQRFFSDGWDYAIRGWYYVRLDNLTTANAHKLILEAFNVDSNLKDGVYNSFMIQGVERTTNQAIISTDSNSNSLTDSSTEGYLGFVSDMTLARPSLSSQAAVNTYMGRMKIVYSKPAYETTIKTIGHIPKYGTGNNIRNLRLSQFININDSVNPPGGKRFRVSEMSHSYSAEQNTWFTTITAYNINAPEKLTTLPPDPPY